MSILMDCRYLIDFSSFLFGIREQRLTFANISQSSSYSHKENIVCIYKRRGGSDNRNLSHNDLLQSVQLEPDVISMHVLYSHYISIEWSSWERILEPCHKPLFEM